MIELFRCLKWSLRWNDAPLISPNDCVNLQEYQFDAGFQKCNRCHIRISRESEQSRENAKCVKITD